MLGVMTDFPPPEPNDERLAAIELLIGHITRWVDDDVLDDTAAALLAEYSGEGLDERDRRIRRLAIELLTSGGGRHDILPVRDWLAARLVADRPDEG